jgi:hypothetical protein
MVSTRAIGGALVAVLQASLHRFVITRDQCFDMVMPGITNPAGEVKPAGLFNQPVAIANALDAAGNEEM